MFIKRKRNLCSCLLVISVTISNGCSGEKELSEAPVSSQGQSEMQNEPKVNVDQKVDALLNSQAPLANRKKSIMVLSNSNDSDAPDVLISIASKKHYLRKIALRAMSGVEGTENKKRICEYLRTLTSDGDALVVCEAITSLGKIEGEDAIEHFGLVLSSSDSRADGMGSIIRTAVVNSLVDMNSEKTVGLLGGEITRIISPEVDLEFYSTVINALANIGTSEAKKHIELYIAKLKELKPNDELVGTYFETKISEAQTLISNQ